MGAFKLPSQIPLWVPFPFFLFFFFIIITILITPSLANDNNDDNDTSSPSPANSNNTNPYANYTPFKPSIAIIVGISTTMFSITFIRTNSGINRGVIESLPIFRFGALRGQKDGFECAVCLTKFESMEVLRLLLNVSMRFTLSVLILGSMVTRLALFVDAELTQKIFFL